MLMVNTHEAKTHLSKLINLVIEKHEVVRICRNGKVVADLVEPVEQVKENRLKINPDLSGVIFYEDPSAPLDDEFIPDMMIAEKGVNYNVTS